VKDEIIKMEMAERVDSDHRSVVTWKRRKRGKEGKNRSERRGVWNEEGRKEFIKNLFGENRRKKGEYTR